MAYANFNEALMEMRRKATLAGRTVSKKEVAGVAEGIARVAPERLTRLKQVELQEKALAEEKRRTDLQVSAAEEAGKREEKQTQVSGAAVGAGIGYYAAKGGAVGGPWGAVIGAGVGFAVSKACIIISACTDPNSYEVNIAREFRDKYLGFVTLVGYYRLAHCVVPFINKSKLIKRLIKKVLVNNLVEYGKWILEYTRQKPSWIEIIVTEGFLKLCKVIGYAMLKAKEA